MKIKEVLIISGIFLLSFLVRFYDLDKSIMVDEPTWLERCYSYWVNLSKGNFAGTLQSGHPGVPNMILAGLGMSLYRFISGNSYATEKLLEFIFYARLPIVIFISISMVFLYRLISNLFNKITAFISVIIFSIDPLFVNFTRLVHVDGLLSVFTFLSILSILNYFKTKKEKYFLYCTIFSSLSFLTKSPSLLILPVIFMTFLIMKKKIWTYIKYLVITVSLMVAVWPVFWSGPEAALKYISKSAYIAVSNAHGTNVYIFEPFYYIEKTMIHSSILTILFIFLSLIYFIFICLKKSSKTLSIFDYDKKMIFLYSLMFVVVLTISAKRGERYILPALIGFIVLGADFFVTVLNKFKHPFIKIFLYGLLFVFTIAQTLNFVSLKPYYLAYYNRLFDSPVKMGFGEGLDLAAYYLNSKTSAEKLTVSSWYPDIFSRYFKGKTKKIGDYKNNDIDYVVLYKGMMGRSEFDSATKILNDFKDKSPEKIISINGMDYIFIYKQ